MCSLENAIETLDKCVLVSKEVFDILLGEYRKHHSEDETTLLIDEQDCGCATEGEIITLLKSAREEQKETPNRYGIPLDIMLHPERVDVNSIPWLPTPPEMLAIIEKLRKDKELLKEHIGALEGSANAFQISRCESCPEYQISMKSKQREQTMLDELNGMVDKYNDLAHKYNELEKKVQQ